MSLTEEMQKIVATESTVQADVTTEVNATKAFWTGNKVAAIVVAVVVALVAAFLGHLI